MDRYTQRIPITLIKYYYTIESHLNNIQTIKYKHNNVSFACRLH